MKDGYYWVKRVGAGTIARLIAGWWNIDGDVVGAYWLEEIGDYIETPDKYK